MKLIDKKGKLFGIINIIDLAVVLIIAVLIVGGIYRFKQSDTEVISNDQKAVVTIEISEVRQPTVDALDTGDELYHYDRGQYFGKIVDKKVENFREPVETDDGKLVSADVPDKFNVILTVEANATNTANAIEIGGEQTRIGTQFRLKNKMVAVFGTIFDIELAE